MWVYHGCRAYLPYISDLGVYGAMGNVFLGGLLVCGVFLICALPHVVVARQRLLSRLQVHERWQSINRMLGEVGVATGVGIALLGFFPWDKTLFLHLFCAGSIFGSGFLWAIGSWVLARRFASAPCSAAVHHTWDAFRRRRRLQLPVAVACAVLPLVSCVGFICAFFSYPGVISPHGIAETLKIANSDFDGYCTGRVGWHGLALINFCALTEWIYVVLLAISVVLSTADVEANSVVEQSFNMLVPMLNAEDREWWRFW